MGRVRSYQAAEFDPGRLRAAKGDQWVTVCIPSRNEERTVGAVVDAVVGPHVARAGGTGLVDEVVVIDDGSSDQTGAAARAAGARVVATAGGGGKGEAMAAGLAATEGDVVVFLDADVENTSEAFVRGLLGPLLSDPTVRLVKGRYERPVAGDPSGGGRVTELVARPLLTLFFPGLEALGQPLAGETAARRADLEALTLAGGYGVEMGLLIDMAARFGLGAIAQVDLGTRIHRNRPLGELRDQSLEVMRAALSRAPGVCLDDALDSALFDQDRPGGQPAGAAAFRR